MAKCKEYSENLLIDLYDIVYLDKKPKEVSGCFACDVANTLECIGGGDCQSICGSYGYLKRKAAECDSQS